MSKRMMPKFKLGQTVEVARFCYVTTSRGARRRELRRKSFGGRAIVTGMKVFYLGDYVPGVGHGWDYEEGCITNAKRVLLYEVRRVDGAMTDAVEYVQADDIVGSYPTPELHNLPVYPDGEKWSERDRERARQDYKAMVRRGLFPRDSRGRFQTVPQLASTKGE